MSVFLQKLPPWVRGVAERAWWSFLATFIATTGYQAGAHFNDINWLGSLEVSAIATVFSMLKTTVVAHLPIGDDAGSAVNLEPAGRHSK